VADKSEPVRASVAELQYLFDRRRRTIDLQDERRARLVEWLRRSIRRQSDGDFVVAIGPTMNTGPMIDFKLLKIGDRLPDQRFYEKATIADGATWIENTDQRGYGVDVFGNVAVVVDKAGLHKEREFEPSMLPLWLSNRFGEATGAQKIPCIELLGLLAPVIEAFELLSVGRDKSEYFGMLRIAIAVRGLTNLMLVCEQQPRPVIIAASRSRGDFAFSFDCLTQALGGDTLAPAANAAERIIWAWGRQLEEVFKWEDPLDWAERQVFGSSSCQCQHYDRPKNRDLCLRCRRQRSVQPAVAPTA
jgi:hypothetical protein